MTNHFRTVEDWLRWFDEAEQRAQQSIAPTPPIERKWISGDEPAGSSLELHYSKPFPLRRRRGR